MASIYLIRHGQASFGAANYDVLSPLGVRQAQLLGDYLASQGIRFDQCYSGSLKRQIDTAQGALTHSHLAGLPVPEVQIDPGFDEFDAEAVIRNLLPSILPEQPEALSVLQDPANNRSAFQHIFALMIERWLSGQYDLPNQPSWQGFLDTVGSSFKRVLEATDEQDNIAVFTSGGTITALLHLLTGMPANKAFEMNWQIINTSVSRLHVRRREATLASFNSRAHLELLKTPELITYR